MSPVDTMGSASRHWQNRKSGSFLLSSFSYHLQRRKNLNKKQTRKEQRQYSEPTEVLYVAFDLGAPNWKLAFSIGLGQKPRERNVAARDLAALGKEVLKAKQRFGLPESAPVVSCYEAGRDGFWLHRYLASVGVENLVVDSSSIEVNRRKRRAKTDKLDAASLLRLLIRHHSQGEHKVWSVVRPPSPEEEDRRELNRERSALKKEKDRTSSRIRGLLATQGVRLSSAPDLSDKRLDSIRLWDGSGLPDRLKSRLRREWRHLVFLKEQMAELEQERKSELRRGEEPDLEKVEALHKLRGVGPVGSWVLVREFFGWRKFSNRREVGSLAGLTPTPFNSGVSTHEQGISKAGNRRIRAVAIELAWSWIRFQPASSLTRWYIQRFDKGGKRARKVGIVALARRLLIELWRYLETGALPEGARLKAHA